MDKVAVGAQGDCAPRRHAVYTAETDYRLTVLRHPHPGVVWTVRRAAEHYIALLSRRSFAAGGVSLASRTRAPIFRMAKKQQSCVIMHKNIIVHERSPLPHLAYCAAVSAWVRCPMWDQSRVRPIKLHPAK